MSHQLEETLNSINRKKEAEGKRDKAGSKDRKEKKKKKYLYLVSFSQKI